MCAQLYFQRAAQPDTWVMSGAPAATAIWLSRDTPINYSDGSTDTLPANTPAAVIGGGTSFDRTHDVYVPFTVKGSGVLSIIKESLLPTLTDDYAPLSRVELHSIKPYQPEPYLAAGGFGATGAPQTVLVPSTALTGKAHDLGAGGSPPASWDTLAFDDSAWTAPVAEVFSTLASPLAGTAWVTYADGSRPANDEWLLRHAFGLPAGTISSASLEIRADDFTEEIYVNGTLVDGAEVQGTAFHTYTLVPADLVAGGGLASNVLAVHVKNGLALSGNPTSLDYLLTVTVAASVGGASEGSLLYFTSGAWANLPIGTSGQELTVTSGDPAWATPAAGYTDPLSTKGDLLTRTSSATVRLGVGSNGQVVTADSTAADGIKWATPSASGVTSIDVAVPAPLSSSGGPITSSGTVTLSWASGQTANRVLASPDGTTGAVSLRALVGADIPVDASTIISSAGTIKGNYQAGSGVSISGNTISATGSGGSVTSVALSLPGIFSLAGSPITTSGVLSVSLASQSAQTVFAGPASGSAAAPTFRVLAASDLPAAAAAGGHVHAHGHFL